MAWKSFCDYFSLGGKWKKDVAGRHDRKQLQANKNLYLFAFCASDSFLNA